MADGSGSPTPRRADAGSSASGPGSRLLRFRGFRPDGAGAAWDGVDVTEYKPSGEDWALVTRQVLVGPGDPTAFHLRYFEVAPGGHTTLEHHAHAHAVVILRGCGRVILGTEAYDLRPFDAVYVSPHAPHQFVNDGDEPLGFLCVVDAHRDRPQPLDAGAVGALLEANPSLAPLLRTQVFRLTAHRQEA
ncbi:MAG: cupin domain-containing protein [Clostridia bacterium]|nr:cupin domain-containing protein [Clostridia bacterium]